MKTVLSNYVFNPAAKTITFPNYPLMAAQGSILLVSNTTRRVDYYLYNDGTLTGTTAGNVLTLAYDTTGHSSTDDLLIYYDDGLQSQLMAGVRKDWHDEFDQGISPNNWTTVNPDGHVITLGGNSAGSCYGRISLSPLLESTEVTITSRETFNIPIRTGFGVSLSQRIVGQEIFYGIVGDDGAGNVDFSAPPWNGGNDMNMPASVVVAVANVVPIIINSHGLNSGDRVNIYGCQDSRINAGPMVVTVVDQNTFSLPITAGIATYTTTGGKVRLIDQFRYALNGSGYLMENAIATNASAVTRRNGSKARTTNITIATSGATQTNVGPYADAFNTGSIYEAQYTAEETSFRSFPADAGTVASAVQKYSQTLPDETRNYHLHVRARNLAGFTRPIARITAIAKTGTTTATVTTDVPHGLTTLDWIQIYGVRDQTNFPNLAVATAVASVVDTTHFTVVIGTASSTSSLDGTVYRVQGGVLAPGIFAQVAQSLSATANILTVIGNATWTTPLPGEFMYLYGLNSAVSAYEGAYKVLRVSTTTLELAPASGSLTPIASTNTGGALIRMTDVRLHFARVFDHTRLPTEIIGGRGNSIDLNNAVTVYVGSGAVSASQSTGISTSQWSAAGWGGFLVADIASAAITTTTTTAAISPGSNITVGTYAHSFNIVVTAATGTTPTMDVVVQESIDNGTNWIDVYHFERITAVGFYTSPLIRAQYGTRYRYVQTIGGTTPSFTRALNRVEFSTPGLNLRRFFDRTVSPNTLNSTTAVWYVEGCDTFQLTVNMGAATTPPQFQLQGSEDGTTWFNLGAALTSVASSTVNALVTGALPKLARVNVSSAGSAATLGYVALKAVSNNG